MHVNPRTAASPFLFLLLGCLLSCDELASSKAPPAENASAPPPQQREPGTLTVTVSAAESSIGGCSSCSFVKAYPEHAGLRVAHSGTGAGISVRKAGDGAAVLVRGGRVELADDGGVLVFASMARVSAAEHIVLPSGASLVKVEAMAGSQKNALLVAKGREGQLLWLYNGDDDPCSLVDDARALIAAGSVRQLLFLDGKWRLVG